VKAKEPEIIFFNRALSMMPLLFFACAGYELAGNYWLSMLVGKYSQGLWGCEPLLMVIGCSLGASIIAVVYFFVANILVAFALACCIQSKLQRKPSVWGKYYWRLGAGYGFHFLARSQ